MQEKEIEIKELDVKPGIWSKRIRFQQGDCTLLFTQSVNNDVKFHVEHEKAPLLQIEILQDFATGRYVLQWSNRIPIEESKTREFDRYRDEALSLAKKACEMLKISL